MSSNIDVIVTKFDFNANMFSELHKVHYAKDLWPIVYILSDGSIMEAYVGETTDTYTRMENHLKNNTKSKLTSVHLITSEKFNKSATLDIESNLIKYISGDGKYRLLNLNVGLANHNYYQKNEIYWNIFKSIWNKLRAEGITRHSIDQIDNSDLFKYSPYKSLTKDQTNSLLMILENLLNDTFRDIVIEGGAGTGKTILAIFLFKLLKSNTEDFNFKEFGDSELQLAQTILKVKKKYANPKMALVVPMSSFRNTLKKVFKNIKGLNANMVIGPSEISKEYFDIIIVDESHRLRRRVNLGSYFRDFDSACKKLGFDKNNCSELDWILKQSKKTILFYDQNQSVKPSDARQEDFYKLKSADTTNIEFLKSQFRVKGGNNYVHYINSLLNCMLRPTDNFTSKEYQFLFFDSIDEMVAEIKLRDKEYGLSRLIAGYSWPWPSKKNKKVYDIQIEGVKLQWNSVTNDFINSPNAVNEVACIHTTQGYDLNYAGIIFGNEIGYNKERNEIIIAKENYLDRNGKASITNPAELKQFIINIYKTILLRGIKGTYIYACDPGLKEYFANHITRFKSQKQLVHLPSLMPSQFENSVRLVDLKAVAGSFSDLQTVENDGWVALPSRYKSSDDLFACVVNGESMNKVIPSGSICLFRLYHGGSRNGKIVLVEHTSLQESDFGSGYTVKEYHSIKKIDDDGWGHNSITLKPLSHDSGYKNIEIAEDELSSLRVIAIFECVL